MVTDHRDLVEKFADNPTIMRIRFNAQRNAARFLLHVICWRSENQSGCVAYLQEGSQIFLLSKQKAGIRDVPIVCYRETVIHYCNNTWIWEHAGFKTRHLSLTLQPLLIILSWSVSCKFTRYFLFKTYLHTMIWPLHRKEITVVANWWGCWSIKLLYSFNFYSAAFYNKQQKYWRILVNFMAKWQRKKFLP